jgi:hypothetical protein
MQFASDDVLDPNILCGRETANNPGQSIAIGYGQPSVAKLRCLLD